MLAVLADAINVLQWHRVSIYGDKHNSFNEALSWVFGELRVTSLLSFDDHVCDALGLDTGSLRRRLLEAVSGYGGNLPKVRRAQRGRRISPPLLAYIRGENAGVKVPQ
jgi:hypothetical protein